LTCKNRHAYNLYCVGRDVKHCTIQPIQSEFVFPAIFEIFGPKNAKTLVHAHTDTLLHVICMHATDACSPVHASVACTGLTDGRTDGQTDRQTVSCMCVLASSVGLMVLAELHSLQSLTVKDNCHVTDDVLQAISHGCPMLTYVPPIPSHSLTRCLMSVSRLSFSLYWILEYMQTCVYYNMYSVHGTGVPWRQPHRHSGLATLPSV